ncbi:caveolin-3-like isoform X2 [Nasonia vitripennis]|nr:caveolin-3-like isoform X2 [Nasonia vitripennis]
MEKPESSMGDDSRVDLEDRDPHRLNQHLQVIWEEVVGEPDGIRSPECAWRLSGHCFRLSRGCCYVLLSVLVAPIIALCLGLTFACLAFEHIWCIGPCLRVWRITCSATRNFCTALVQSVVRPCTDSLGYFFYNIRVLNQRLPDANDHKEDVHIV